jgi:Predicted membrane protein (DUF2085)
MTLAKRAPGILLVLSVVWSSTLIAIPYLVSHARGNLPVLRGAQMAYVLGSLVCHQRPERSFHPWDIQVPVCARCEGIYLAAPFGLALMFAARQLGSPRLRSRRLWRRVISLACLPTILTLAWEWTTGDMSSGTVRAAAGGVLGAAIAATVAAVATGELR